MIYPRIARLNTNGSTDTSFDVGQGANATARCVAIRPDGKVVVGGDFTTVDGVAQSRLTLRNEDGSLSDGFDLTANDTVTCAIASTDGKVIIGGDFTSISGSTRNRMARITAADTLEPAFNPNVNNLVWALAGQQDGKVIIGGLFSTVGGASYPYVARLYNDTASNTLTVVSSSTVTWERSGASPETHRVTFDVSTDGGSSWTPIGVGTSYSGGWTLTGLTLSGDGILRARAYPHSASSEGILEATTTFDFVPEIQVEQPESVILTDAASTVAYGDVQIGSSQTFVFYIRNIGLANLALTTPTQVAVSGADAAQWSLAAQPSTPVAPGSAVTFSLTFTPTTTGSKTALLTILSDDADEGTFTLNLTGTGAPGAGSRDTTFQPTLNNVVYAVATNILDKITIGGDFISVNGSTRNRIASLNLSGTTDTGFTGTGANNTVRAAATLSDGSIILGGYFSSVNGVTRRRLAKVSQTGVLDASFNPNVSAPTGSYISAMDVSSTGKILVAGFFSTIGGISRPNVAVLAANGNVDTSFNPPSAIFSGSLRTCARFDSQGRILVSTTTHLARTLANGTPDPTFGTSGMVIANQVIYTFIERPDGKILVGGNFTTIGGESKDRLALLNTDGTVDTAFTCSVNSNVTSLALQTDGSVILYGGFTTVNGGSAPYIARILEDGTLDTTFTASLNPGILGAIAIQEDGDVLVSGQFTLEGTPSIRLARLVNGAASDELSLLSATEAQWLRNGTCPEVGFTQFEYSQDSGATWVSLGAGTRIDGGWGATGLSLPVSGLLRAVGRNSGGVCSGLVSTEIPFSGLVVADIQVEQPANTIIADNGSRAFPGRLLGQFADLIFTIRNTGNATLTSISAVSTNPTEFTILSAPATSIAAGGSTTMTVRFQPAAIGARASTLSIISSVAGAKNPYVINLTGNGITTPLVTTLSAQSITSTTALLRGNFTARDDAAYAYFQYRTSSADPWTTSPMVPLNVAGGFTTQLLTHGITGLNSADTYQFRALIYNSVTGSGSPVAGGILSFTTAP
jgi:uncharacterized delta-60 repeat protein